jgi:hypothetical protein
MRGSGALVCSLPYRERAMAYCSNALFITGLPANVRIHDFPSSATARGLPHRISYLRSRVKVT